MKTENPILDKSFEFSISIIELYKKLVACNEFVISKQILRSATSIGANVREATAAQSKRDFIIDYNELLFKSLEIIKILTSIVKSAQQSLEIKP